MHIEAFVALQANESRIEQPRQRLGDFRLADASLAFQQQWAAHLHRQQQGGGKAALRDEAMPLQPLLQAHDVVHAIGRHGRLDSQAVLREKRPRSQSRMTAHASARPFSSECGASLSGVPEAASASDDDVAADCMVARRAAKLATNCLSIWSATGCIRRPPRAAALPLIVTSLLPVSSHASPAARTAATRSIDAADVPVASAPLPTRCRLRAVASRSITSISPLNDIVAGPSRTVMVPL